MENLYHYTSMQGFESIIKNQTIRMTRSDFMNDPNDCKVFYNIVKEYISKKMKNIDVKFYLRHVKNTEKIYPSDVDELIKRYPLDDYLQYVYNNISLYIFSLSDCKDSLPMWNYYGNDGICMGFEKESFLLNFAQKVCKGKYDFLAYTKVNYIDINKELMDLPLNSLTDVQLFKQTSQNKSSFYEILLHEYKKDNENINLELFVESYIESYIVSINFLLRDPKEEHQIFEEFYEITSPEGFFNKIFVENRALIEKKGMSFKSHIDIFMLILSAKYKPKTFENESETRIVFFNYDIPQKVDEKYATFVYNFGSFIKPFIESEFAYKDNFPLSNEVKSIILSPSTKRIPIDENTYKKIICKFLRKDDSFNIEISKHDIRW